MKMVRWIIVLIVSVLHLYGVEKTQYEMNANDPSVVFKKVVFEPKIVYSKDKALCEAVLKNHQKSFFKGSNCQEPQGETIDKLSWISQVEERKIENVIDIGTIDLHYEGDKNATLVQLIKPFNWKGDTHSVLFYPSSLSTSEFKTLTQESLDSLEAKGKAIYPDLNISDWNQSTYDTTASKWWKMSPFKFHNKYYFENEVNPFWSISQYYLTTLEIEDTGALKPLCVIQTKKWAKNPLHDLKNVGTFLESLNTMTGRYGSCGTLAAGDMILRYSIPDMLENIAYAPWKEVSKYEKVKISTLHGFLQEWGYLGLWNYDVFSRYDRVRKEALRELKQYYMDGFGLNEKAATKYAEKAYFEILNAHFTFPKGGYGRQLYDNVQRALLEGKSEEEIKPLLVRNWEHPQNEMYGQELEATLFSALKSPQLVTFLLREGADVNVTNSFGKTALMYAAQYNLYETAELLIKSGIDVNKQTFRSDDTCTNTIGTQGVTALHYAVRYADAKFIDLLVKNGANKDIKDSAEKIAFDWVDVFSKENKYLSSDDVQQVKKFITPMSEDEKKKVIQNHVETARKAYSAKEYEKAASFYEKALLYDTKNIIIWSDLALVYYRMGEYPKATKAASNVMYNDKATPEQQASAFYNMAMICGVVGNYISYEGQGYCHFTPLNDFIRADMKRSTPDRVAKIVEMLKDDYRPKFTYSHVLLESSDKKQKIVYSYPKVYLFTQEPLSDELSVAVTYKSGVKAASSFRKWHEITSKNEHYYIYENTNSLSLGNQNEQKICYDKECTKSMPLKVIYQNKEY